MSRPILARKDTKAEESAQRRKVRERDGGICRFEKMIVGRAALRRFGTIDCWGECGSKAATDTAHIYRRHECGKARFHEDVALLACRDCHTAYDNRVGGVRAPPDREAIAYARIVANSKVAPPRQTPEGVRA